MIKSADQCLCRGQVKESKTKTFGDGGYRSPYLSHAKRALYHLSYVPGVVDCETELDVNHPKVKVTIGELELDLAWLCCLQQYTSLDSSVGRAVDCSCTLSDIHRSLVQIRLEGFFVKINFVTKWASILCEKPFKLFQSITSQ